MNRVASVLVSSVIAAAFLGPGTVTTAGRAGAGHGTTLLWALAFSAIACFVLQEASARLTTASGLTLGEALRQSFRLGSSAWAVRVLVLGAIVVGCAAYEAGNLLGGTAGAGVVTDLPAAALTLGAALAAAVLLWLADTRIVVNVLSTLVALMGAAFVATAIALRPPVGPLFEGLFVPRLPDGATLLVLGLVGTTVVPYNLFLGSGLAHGQDPRTARFGLAVAIGLGGLISMAVVVVGSAVQGEFSYAALAGVLEARLGGWARTFFGLGLFAAGFTSAVTAPLAAAMTARSMLARGSGDARWQPRGLHYRGVWLLVLTAGTVFGLSGVRPIPAIIAAQALNGVLLPVVAVFLLVAINDRRLLGDAVNRPLGNVFGALVVFVALLLGLLGVARAVSGALGIDIPLASLVNLATALALITAWPVASVIRRARGPAIDA